jgi:2-polyprenyl-6-methoxyphenol hydroxylase-like FAD-dependent oxidoreductase
MSNLKILLVGGLGGIGGVSRHCYYFEFVIILSILIFLSRLPVQVTYSILESHPTRSAGGLLKLSPNGMRVFAGLGLADTIMQRDNAIEVPWFFMYDSSRNYLGKVPQGGKIRYGYSSIMTTRTDIHEVLLEDADKRGIEVRYGAKVKALQ